MPRVLVIDDNQDAADSLAANLRMSGYDVETAYTGMSALARVQSFHPDVVLCDLGLPELSGYEIARVVRGTQTCPIRLVAISGYAADEDVRRSREAGFDAHIAKPPRPGDIESQLSITAA